MAKFKEEAVKQVEMRKSIGWVADELWSGWVNAAQLSEDGSGRKT